MGQPAPSAASHLIEGALPPAYVTEAAPTHKAARFDLVLLGYLSSAIRKACAWAARPVSRPSTSRRPSWNGSGRS